MKATNIGLVEYLTALEKRNQDTVYMLSGIGRPLTKSMVDARIKRGDKLAIANQDLLYDSLGKYVYDCVGAIKSYRMTGGKPFGKVNYEVKYDQNVRMMWDASKEKGEVKNEDHPEIIGLLVMTGDLGHVGVYVGKENGKRTYIECTVTGKAWKVIKSYGYKGKKHTWSKWAKYSYVDYVKPPVKPDPKPKGKYAIGQEVVINGRLYGNADGKNPGGTVKNKTTKITMYVPGKAKPYNTTGSLGWIGEDQIKVVIPTPKPDPKPDPKPTVLKVGDRVEIIATGNTQTTGKGRVSDGRGYKRTILSIYPGNPYPYQVGSGKTSTGFYSASALKKL